MRLNLNEIMRIEKSAFEYSEFGALESVEIGDKLYFPASECAKVLGYHNPRKAIIDHCEETIRLTVPHPQSPSKTIEKNYISEGDMYRLIFGSRLPAAEVFQRWVTHEVLPCIRQYGCYFTPKFLAECNNDPEEVKRRIHKMKMDKLLEHFLENPDDAIKAYTDLVCRRNVVEADGAEVRNETDCAIECADFLSSAD